MYADSTVPRRSGEKAQHNGRRPLDRQAGNKVVELALEGGKQPWHSRREKRI
jgi:hypothetical protein